MGVGTPWSRGLPESRDGILLTPLEIASVGSEAAAGPGGDSEPDAWESGLGFCPSLWPTMALEKPQPPYAGDHKADPQGNLCRGSELIETSVLRSTR